MKIFKLILFFFLGLMLSSFSYAWDSFISPERVIKLIEKLKIVEDSQKSSIYNEIAFEYIQNYFESERIIQNAQKALEYSNKYNQIDQQVRALSLLGYGNGELKDNLKAKQYFDEAFKLVKNHFNPNDNIYLLDLHIKYLLLIYEYEKALEESKQMGLLCEKIKDAKLIAYSLYKIAKSYQTLRNFVKYDEYLRLAFNKFNKIGDLEYEIDIKINLIFLNSNHSVNDLNTLMELKEICERSNHLNIKKKLAFVLNGIGFFYSYIKDFNKALTFFNQALEILKKNGLSVELVQINMLLGECYFYGLNDYNKSLKYLKEAEIILNKSKVFPELMQADIYLDFGELYTHLENYSLAKDYFKKCLKILEMLNPEEAQKPRLYYGRLFFKTNNYEEAEKIYLNCLSYINKQSVKDTTELLFSIDIYDFLIELYKKWGKYKEATEYYQKRIELRENVLEKNQKKIAEYEKKNEADKREIAELKASRAANTRNLSFIIIFLILVIVAIYFRRYSSLLAFWKKENIIGKYKILERIGIGGFGKIFKAQDTESKQIVALKELHENLLDQDSIKRFKNEGIIIQRLSHDHIVKFIDTVDISKGSKTSKLAIVMEYLNGNNLGEFILKNCPIPVNECNHITRQIVSALEYIHSRNIIHRDLKPGNIMLTNNNGDPHFVKLLDFGIAKSKFFTKMTLTGTNFGSVNYMSPEQRTDSQDFLTVASDIFSLGLLCYEMYTGKYPFPKEEYKNELLLTIALKEENPPEPIAIRADIPKAINDMIFKMIAKKPSERPSASDIFKILSTN